MRSLRSALNDGLLNRTPAGRQRARKRSWWQPGKPTLTAGSRPGIRAEHRHHDLVVPLSLPPAARGEAGPPAGIRTSHRPASTAVEVKDAQADPVQAGDRLSIAVSALVLIGSPGGIATVRASLVAMTAGDGVLGVGDDGAVVEKDVDVVLGGQQRADIAVQDEVRAVTALDRLGDFRVGGVHPIRAPAGRLTATSRPCRRCRRPPSGPWHRSCFNSPASRSPSYWQLRLTPLSRARQPRCDGKAASTRALASAAAWVLELIRRGKRGQRS